jgi:hypothetical protein
MTENRHRNEQSKHQHTLCLCMKVAQGILLKTVIKFGGHRRETRENYRGHPSEQCTIYACVDSHGVTLYTINTH